MMESSAGSSASREHRRRSRADTQRRRSSWRRRTVYVAAGAIGAAAVSGGLLAGASRALGWLGLPGIDGALTRELVAITALTAVVAIGSRGWRPPQDTTSWEEGAEGERRISAALAPLSEEGWVFLHDRTRRGSQANIDHIAVGPAGVWMVETKRWRGQLEAGPHRLRLNGRPIDHVYDQLWRQADAVTVAGGGSLSRIGLKARPVLCVEGTKLVRLPDRWGHRVHGPIEIHDSATLVRRLRSAPQVLSGEEVTTLAHALDQALPPA